MSDLTSVMELEKTPFSCKMKIKTVTKYIGEKKKYRQYITRFYQAMDIRKV